MAAMVLGALIVGVLCITWCRPDKPDDTSESAGLDLRDPLLLDALKPIAGGVALNELPKGIIQSAPVHRLTSPSSLDEVVDVTLPSGISGGLVLDKERRAIGLFTSSNHFTLDGHVVMTTPLRTLRGLPGVYATIEAPGYATLVLVSDAVKISMGYYGKRVTEDDVPEWIEIWF